MLLQCDLYLIQLMQSLHTRVKQTIDLLHCTYYVYNIVFTQLFNPGSPLFLLPIHLIIDPHQTWCASSASEKPSPHTSVPIYFQDTVYQMQFLIIIFVAYTCIYMNPGVIISKMIRKDISACRFCKQLFIRKYSYPFRNASEYVIFTSFSQSPLISVEH